MASKLTQDESVILALASGLSQRQAARQTGLSQRTIARRMAQPEFRKQVTARRAELLEETAGRLTAMTRNATATLRKLLNSKSDVVRLGACRVILESAINLRNMVEFEQRLAALEGAKK